MTSRPHAPLAAAALAAALVLAACDDGPTDPLPVGAVIVTSVSPETLRPGDEMTIEGENFRSDAESNIVRIHGVRVPVVDAAATRLIVEVPDNLCLPPGPVPVTVAVEEEESEPVIRAFDPGRSTEIEPGQILRLTSADDLCLILGGSGSAAEYVVGTQSTSGTPGVVASALVRGRVPFGEAGAAVAGAAGVLAGPPSPLSAGIVGGGAGGVVGGGPGWSVGGGAGGERAGVEDLRWARHLEAEVRLRARERRVLEAVAADRRAAGLRAAAPARAAAVPGNVEPGDTVTVMVPDISSGDDTNPCEDGEVVRAIVRRIGANSIWLDDVENPPGGFTGADYDLLSDEFDNVIYDEVVDYFGEPTDIDDNDRIVIVVSQEVNRMSTALAFVVAADFFPDQCPGANGGEFYYARAPDPGGEIPGPDGETFTYSRADALSDAPRLLAHELTHIIQFGRRLQLPAPDGAFQAIWLLEGQATFAEEVVGHRYSGLEPGENLGAGPALQQVFEPTDVPWYRVPFVDLAVYFGFGVENGSVFRVEGAPEECSWLSFQNPEPCISGRIAYGVTWSLLRWASDHFADRGGPAEREMQRRIVDSPRFGFETLEEVIGEDIEVLLAPWAAMLYTDGRLGAAGDFDPLLTFPSWDLRDIENAIVSEGRLRPEIRSFGDFEDTAEIAAASSLYHLVRTTSGHPPFALSARTAADNPLPAFMQLWVARIR